jgi:hypothetical protein
VLHGVLDRSHPGVVTLDVANTVQLRGNVETLNAEDGLHPGHMEIEEVDQRARRCVQRVADLCDGGCRKCQWCDRPRHRLVENGDEPPSLLDGGNERDHVSLESKVGELDEQRVAHRLRADAGAVREKEHRHRRSSAIQMSVHREAPLEFHPRVGGGRRFSRPDIMTPDHAGAFRPELI